MELEKYRENGRININKAKEEQIFIRRVKMDIELDYKCAYEKLKDNK